MISLSVIQQKLGDLVQDTWSSEVQAWGELVDLYRKYADGEHRAKLTPVMRQMLRISDARIDQFNSNYCDLVVSTMADRLNVSGITADTQAGSDWAAQVMRDNRFDGLMKDVMSATVRDGDSFLMVTYDNEKQTSVFVHELAFDGSEGIIPVYDVTRSYLTAAVKIWCWNNVDRFNIYYPDRVEKYSASGTLEDGEPAVQEYEPPASLTTIAGQTGVPVIHFKNRARSRMKTGISELAAAVPMQDALNRTIVSMVMTAELSGFPIRVSKGFEPPANLSPGMWLKIAPDGMTKEDVAEADTMQQAELAPFINQAMFLIEQIGTVTRTPLPAFMGGDSASGEALKQREVGLLAKVEQAQVKMGNAWEDAMMLAHRMQQVFGKIKPPAVARFDCRWKDAQVRNDAQLIANAVLVADHIGTKWFIKTIAPVFGWTEEEIQQIIDDKETAAGAKMAALGAQLPRFNNFNAPAGNTQAQQNGQANGQQGTPQPVAQGAAL